MVAKLVGQESKAEPKQHSTERVLIFTKLTEIIDYLL